MSRNDMGLLRNGTGLTQTSRRRYLQSIGTAASISMLAGCLGGTGGREYERTLGFPTPQSGPLAAIGGQFIKGARLALDDVNEESDDEDITLEIEDSRATPEQALSVVKDMVDRNIPAITGTVSSDVGASVANLVEEREIPYMATVSQNPAITSGKTYSFQYITIAQQGAIGHLEFADAVDASGYAFLGADYSYPRSVFDGMKQAKSHGDYSVNIEQSFFTPLGTGDFRPILNKIDTENIDVLELAYPGGNAVVLVEQIKELGLHNEIDYIWGDTTYQTPILLEPLGTTLTGIGSYGADFSTDYSKQIDSRVDGFAGAYLHYAYDVVYILASAMNSTDLDPTNIRDEIKNQSYPSRAVGYESDFNDEGRNLGARLIISRWANNGGEMVPEPLFKSDPLPIPNY